MPSSTLSCPLVLVLALGLLAAPASVAAKDPDVVADAGTRLLLRPAEYQRMRLSPDGTRLAIVHRFADGAIVSVHRSNDMTLIKRITPGKGGVVTALEWLDDDRLLIGATLSSPRYGMPMTDPSMYISRFDGTDMFKLPGNFLATIDGDPDHLLVSECKKYVEGDCVLEIRRADIHRLRRLGDLVITAPAADTTIIADQQGNIRFAHGIEDDGNTKTWLHLEDKEPWTLINDSTVTGIDVMPLGVSRDGKSALLQTQRRQGTDAIETYDFATGARKELFRDPDSDPLSIIPSLDDKEVIGAVYGATRPRQHFWDADAPDATLYAELGAAFPGKQVAVISASKDGTSAVALVDSDRDPGTYYLFERKAHNADTLARKMPWLRDVPLGEQKAVQFTTRDGLILHGVLTLPPGRGMKDALPLVVLPHGGPYEVVDLWGFDPETQILATHGYAVLQVNFRGSAGYGLAFAQRGMMQWGRAMQDDLTDATRWAINQGIADRDRICIYGASYGGYAALMGAVREPGLYRCAVGVSGVFDLSKLYQWGSIRRSDYGKNYLKRVIGEDRGDLAARSPSVLAGKITVPVLLAHGALDARVDVRHARLMRNALEKRGGSVQLIEYPNTGHSLVLDGVREDFYARLLDFLGKHLGKPPVATP